jgi:replication-associated recombination protein RarA
VARAEVTRARSGRRTILFVDEVHRFNKAQQDAFLPYVEGGLLTFVGATTENPSFEVNSALLSRASVYVLQPLSAEEMGNSSNARCRRCCPITEFRRRRARTPDRSRRRRRATPAQPDRTDRHGRATAG